MRLRRRSAGWYLLPVTLFLALALGPVQGAGAQQVPPWVSYQLGQMELRNRNYAQALELFSEALAGQPLFPEALAGIAATHQAVGDFSLAREYYLSSLHLSSHLVVKDDENRLRMNLVELLEFSDHREDEELLRAQLDAVIASDPIFTRRDPIPHQRDQMVSLLYGGGLDRVIVLYRLSHPQSTAGHRRMGTLLMSSDDEDDRRLAVEHLLFAVVEITGRAVEAIIAESFRYQFTTMENFLETVQRYPAVRDYIAEVELIRILRELETALSRSPDAGATAAAAEIARNRFIR